MSRRLLAIVLGLWALALLSRLAVAAAVHFPMPEDSAYYVAAARNLIEGRGLVVDAAWSYATPPLTLPRPAFELWQPLATFLLAASMAVLGPTLAAAQAASAVIGAAAAPLTWAIARDATREMGLPPRRARTVELGSGLAVALLGPLLLQAAAPDSSATFTTLALLACWMMPRALAAGRDGERWRLALGVTLGLAYLTRQEALYLGLAYLVVLASTRSARPSAGAVRLLAVPLLAALVVVAPWLVRQALTWERPLFAQTLENAWLLRNQDIFAWAERPTLARYLAAGPQQWIDLRLGGIAQVLGLDLLVAAFPIGLVGLLTLAARPRLPRLAALRPLLLYGLLAFAAATLVFPVASRWGTFRHAEGPAVALLAIAASLGLDGLVAAVRRLRRWPRENAWLAPLALLAVTVPLAVLEGSLAAGEATETETRYAALGHIAPAWGLAPGSAPVVGNHPIWLSEALEVGALALPDEAPSAVLDLASHFGATTVVVDGMGLRYPAGFERSAADPATLCFQELPGGPEGIRAFRIGCTVGAGRDGP